MYNTYHRWMVGTYTQVKDPTVNRFGAPGPWGCITNAQKPKATLREDYNGRYQPSFEKCCGDIVGKIGSLISVSINPMLLQWISSQLSELDLNF